MIEKILLTWLLFFIPIILFGYWELAHTDNDFRWYLLGTWMMGVMVIALYAIWWS